MIRFDLRGKNVGQRLIKAISKAAAEDAIALDCAGARFVAAMNLREATLAEADFTGAIFERGLRLEKIVFPGDAFFDRARSSEFSLRDISFKGTAALRGLRCAHLVVRDTSFNRYASFDEAVIQLATFRDVVFAAEARFRQLQCAGPATLRSVRFRAAASFQEASLERLSCPGCRFEGPLQTQGLTVESSLRFVGSRFDDTRSLELQADETVSLREASFAQSVVLSVAGGDLEAEGACFERGADLMLEPGSRGHFGGASFFGPTRIATREPDDRPPAKIVSLDRTRVDRLTLQELDLSECSFAQLHSLDDVLIAGRGQLGLAPEVVEGSYRREVLADEVVRRATTQREMLDWAPVSWRCPPGLEGQTALEPQTIAELYRAMRKSREDSNDYPGAGDFYYGEMEMRREGASNLVERGVLTLYWLVSGYGLRAARALVAFLLMVLLLAVGFQTIGLEDPEGFSQTLAWTLSTSISLTRSVEQVSLTPTGAYLNVLARVLGPVLLALFVLALRSRVRR